MIRFVNEHRDRFGVELICQVLRPAVLVEEFPG